MINTYEFVQDGVATYIPFDEEVMVNATKVYQSFNIPDSSFASFKKRTLIPIAERMVQLSSNQPNSQNAVSVNNLIVTRKGGDDKYFQGTWLHPRLAVVFARWISIDFGIWCDDKILELLKTGVVGATDEITKELNDNFIAKSKGVADYIKSKGFRQGNQTINKFVEWIELADKQGISFTELLKTGSKAAGKEHRDKFYTRILKALEQAAVTHRISTGSYVDKCNEADKFQKQLLRRKANMYSNKYNKASMELSIMTSKLESLQADILTQPAIQATVTSDEIIDLTQQIEDLKQKLALYADEEAVPPIDLIIRPTTALSDLSTINNKIKSNGFHALFSGILMLNSSANTPGKNGKNRPLFIGTTNDSNSIGIWPTEGVDNYTISISTKMNTGYTHVFKSVLLSKSAICPSLFLGYHITNDGNRYYIGFESVTASLVIYRV